MLEVVGAQPGQRLQLQGLGQRRGQRGQAVTVGALVVGKLERISRIVLRLGRAPARTGGVKSVGVHRDHVMPGGQQQPVHDQAPGGLNGHRNSTGRP